MYAQLTFIHALSPLHAGVGQGSGIIDLPIAREKATGIPYLPGSSLKGALRARSYNKLDEQKCRLIFGPEDINGEDIAASLAQFSDQRLLLLPTRSLAGTFAWTTSAYTLYRLQQDLQDSGVTPPEAKIPDVADFQDCITTNNTVITLNENTTNKVFLEDLDLNTQNNQDLHTWAEWLAQHIFPKGSHWQNMLPQRLCLVHDDLFSFLLETGTEVNARIRLNKETKTVTKGALWYEETLPTESILTGIVLATPHAPSDKYAHMTPQDIFSSIEKLTQTPIHLGGKTTVGRGLCRVQIIGGNN